MTRRDKLELGLKDDAAVRRDNLPAGEVHGPEEASGPGRSPVVTEARDGRQPPPREVKDEEADDGVTDAQSSDMENEGSTLRRNGRA